MALCYKQVCDLLKQAEPAVPAVPYSINFEAKWNNIQFKEKVENKNKKYSRQNGPKDVILKGSCEIGHFTGNELLGVFTGIFTNYDKWQVGDCLCLTVREKECAAILFHKFFPMNISSHEDQRDGKFIFCKLFDDNSVNQSREGKYKEQYSERVIRELRKEAKEEYFNFLNEKFVDFRLSKFGLSFLGLTTEIAFRSSDGEPLRKKYPDVADIPFAACVKLAFDADLSGKITDLFGVIGHSNIPSAEARMKKKAEFVLSTAKEMICQSIPPNEDGKWEEEKVKEIIRKIQQEYGVED